MTVELKTITREQDSHRHEDFCYVKEDRVCIQIKPNDIQNVLFLLTKLIFTGIKPIWVTSPIHFVQRMLICLLFFSSFTVCWLITRQLEKELFAAWYSRIHLIVFGCNKQACETLKHDECLVHIFLVYSELKGKELVQNANCMI